MKYLINYLLTALLAATALARPPSQLRDRELPPGAYWEGDVLVLDPILDVDKRSEQPPGPFGDIDATKWANFANLSAVPDVTGLANEMGPHIAATVPPIPKDSKKLILETRIGGLNSYVGTLRKDRLEEAIYQCLTWSCPLDDPKRGMNECNGYNAWNPCKVNHIVYEGSAGKYHSDAGLYIWTNKAFHNPDLAGFGEAMYRAAAKVYRMSTDSDGSCHWVNFDMSRQTKLCNGASHVTVAFPGSTDENLFDTSGMQGMVSITVEYNRYTPTTYLLDDNFRFNLFSMMDQNLVPTIAKAIGKETGEIIKSLTYKDIHACPPWFWYDKKCA